MKLGRNKYTIVHLKVNMRLWLNDARLPKGWSSPWSLPWSIPHSYKSVSYLQSKKNQFALLSTPSKLPMVHRSFNYKDDNYWALTEKKPIGLIRNLWMHSHVKVSIYMSGRALLGRNKDDFQKMAARDKHAVWREC